jgi:hypothetical protein
MLLPTWALPKLKLAGETDNWAGALQVPESAIVALESDVPWWRTREPAP